MLPTFVIGLREGLEASLIVGIVAGFLARQGRRDLLRWVYIGVAAAVALCLAVGVALELLSRDLPQRQQEGLETVVGLFAVAMVTYMVVWMKRHSRELKRSLEGAAADAMAAGAGASTAGRALVVMAFLAVLREGFETVVFLLAAFNETGNGAGPIAGALLGVALAVGLGYGIYRGGVRLNLSKFFRATGLVLVVVAAGLLVTALHTAHEAGWLNAGQRQAADISWLVRPGTVESSLLTGILGLQPQPVVIEVVGWFCYLVPVGLYVAWPPGRGLARRTVSRLAAGGAAVLAVTAALLVLLAPSPASHPVTRTATSSATVVAVDASRATVRLADGATTRVVRLRRSGSVTVAGTSLPEYSLTQDLPVTDRPTRLSAAAVARLDGGRLPLGVGRAGSLHLRWAARQVTEVAVSGRRVVSLQVMRSTTAAVVTSLGGGSQTVPLDRPVSSTTSTWPTATVAAAMAAARHDADIATTRDDMVDGGWAAGVVALALLALAAGARLTRRRGDQPGRVPVAGRHPAAIR